MFNKNKKIEIEIDGSKIEILEEEIIIEEIPKNNLCINGNREFKVGLDINISKELKMEGIVRDLVRHVQNLRKESNLEVSDRILFAVKSSSDILNSVKQFEDYFKNETLIDLVCDNIDSLEHKANFKINNVDVEIAISKILNIFELKKLLNKII